MTPPRPHYPVIVVGGGHAGAEAAWAAANVLASHAALPPGQPSVALVTLDPASIAVMPCNPAIGGLAKGQIVRELDALHGLMPLAADATGIQFRLLNASKGPAVQGPRAQCDKHAYARSVQSFLHARDDIHILHAAVLSLNLQNGRLVGLSIRAADGSLHNPRADAVVLTTGTFMRGLMHSGPTQTPGGRAGEPATHHIAQDLERLGLQLHRLKTGTPPRLKRASIDWLSLPPQLGDTTPTPFSDLSDLASFPALPQVECRSTRTSAASHALITANLHRAPMYSGQIAAPGPRYCPSIEDKVVRFPERDSHNVFLEPESLTDDSIYCNGISTSLPHDIQLAIVRDMPGCHNAHVLRFGYAVEYDAVRSHQLHPSGACKPIDRLFLAGQINGTSGYEEAAAQGLVAGLNAARAALALPPRIFARHECYAGVLMDDLSTKTPVEPYRMFSSRAEHRLRLRADNAADRLTPLAQSLGLLGATLLPSGQLGRDRWARFTARREELARLNAAIDSSRALDQPLDLALRRPDFSLDDLRAIVGHHWSPAVLTTAATDRFYAPFLSRADALIARTADLERRRIPDAFDPHAFPALRAEARTALAHFRPPTLGHAARLEGLTPADITLLSVLIARPTPPRAPIHASA